MKNHISRPSLTLKAYRSIAFISLCVYMSFIWLILSYISHNYSQDIADNYKGAGTILLIIHSVICAKLFSLIAKKPREAWAIGVAIFILNYFCLGIGLFALTIYIIVKPKALPGENDVTIKDFV